MGLGLVLVCAPAAVDAVKSLLSEVMVVGQVAPQTGQDRVIFL
jgi:phosphoribosylaminoimidazole (AIR) synthetase